MNLLIMGLREAVSYEPTDPTYAIRIDSELVPFSDNLTLQESGLYTIVTYIFDDRAPEWGEGKLFDVETAERLLTDFKEMGLDKKTLSSHCTRGINRSPAVGIALNEAFGLGHDTTELKRQYPHSNWFVYDTLIEVAKSLL